MARVPVLKLTAKVLLQFEGKDPIEVGEVEIPINVSAGHAPPTLSYPPGVRGVESASRVAPRNVMPAGYRGDGSAADAALIGLAGDKP